MSMCVPLSVSLTLREVGILFLVLNIRILDFKYLDGIFSEQRREPFK